MDAEAALVRHAPELGISVEAEAQQLSDILLLPNHVFKRRHPWSLCCRINPRHGYFPATTRTHHRHSPRPPPSILSLPALSAYDSSSLSHVGDREIYIEGKVHNLTLRTTSPEVAMNNKGRVRRKTGRRPKSGALRKKGVRGSARGDKKEDLYKNY